MSLQGINFQDAFNFDRAQSKMTNNLLSQINGPDISAISDSAIIGLQLIELSQSKDIILAQFPKAVRGLIADGTVTQLMAKNGEKLLIAVDSKGRQFVSNAKQIDPLVITKVAKLASVIVVAAHIISGYDNAKKLKTIDKKLDILMNKDSNSLLAQIESIFESMKEHLKDTDTESGRAHLINLKLHLKEMRCRWFRDISSDLRAMQNPEERGFLTKLFSRSKTTVNTLKNELSSQEEPLYLIRFAVNLENIIAQVISDKSTFRNSTIPDITRQISELSDLVKERRDWISKLKVGSEEDVSDLIRTCENFQSSLGSDLGIVARKNAS